MTHNTTNRRTTDRPRRAKVLFAIAFAAIVYFTGYATGPAVTQALHDEAQRNAHPVPRALPEGVSKFHDASEEVTCWREDASISCLPDQWLASARVDDRP
jgi:hypothetical protein